MIWLLLLISLIYSANSSILIFIYTDQIYLDKDGVCGGNRPCFRDYSSISNSPIVYENTTLYIYPGNYTINGSIKLKNIIGLNKNSVMVNFSAQAINDLKIQNLTIIGFSLNGSENLTINEININRSFNISFKNILIENSNINTRETFYLNFLQNGIIYNSNISVLHYDMFKINADRSANLGIINSNFYFYENYYTTMMYFSYLNNLNITNSKFINYYFYSDSGIGTYIYFRYINNIYLSNVSIDSNTFNRSGYLGVDISNNRYTFGEINLPNGKTALLANGVNNLSKTTDCIFLFSSSNIYINLNNTFLCYNKISNSQNISVFGNNQSFYISDFYNSKNIKLENLNIQFPPYISELQNLTLKNIKTKSIQFRNSFNIEIINSFIESAPDIIPINILNSSNLKIINSSILGNPKDYAIYTDITNPNISIVESNISSYDILLNPKNLNFETQNLEHNKNCSQNEDLLEFNTSLDKLCAVYMYNTLYDYSFGKNHKFNFSNVNGNISYTVICYNPIGNQNLGFENSTSGFIFSPSNSFARTNVDSYKGNYSIISTNRSGSIRLNASLSNFKYFFAFKWNKSQDLANLQYKPNYNFRSSFHNPNIWNLVEGYSNDSEIIRFSGNSNNIIYIDEIYVTEIYGSVYCSGVTNKNVSLTSYISNILISSNLSNMLVEFPNPFFNMSDLYYYESFDYPGYVSGLTQNSYTNEIYYIPTIGKYGTGGVIRANVYLDSIAKLPYKDYTFSFWIRNSPSINRGILDDYYYFYYINILQYPPSYYIYFYPDSGRYISRNSSNEWDHIAIVYNSSNRNFSIYLNGKIVFSSSVSAGSPYRDPYIYLLKSDLIIDELMVFARPLSQNEIQGLYNGDYYIDNLRIVDQDGKELPYYSENNIRLWILLSNSTNITILKGEGYKSNYSVYPVRNIPNSSIYKNISQFSNYSTVHTSYNEGVLRFRVYNKRPSSYLPILKIFSLFSEFSFNRYGSRFAYEYFKSPGNIVNSDFNSLDGWNYSPLDAWTIESGNAKCNEIYSYCWIAQNIQLQSDAQLITQFTINNVDKFLVCIDPEEPYHISCRNQLMDSYGQPLYYSGSGSYTNYKSLRAGNHTIVFIKYDDQNLNNDLVFIDKTYLRSTPISNSLNEIGGYFEIIYRYSPNKLYITIGKENETLMIDDTTDGRPLNLQFFPISNLYLLGYTDSPVFNYTISNYLLSGCRVESYPSGVIKHISPVRINSYQNNITCLINLQNYSYYINLSKGINYIPFYDIYEGKTVVYNISCKDGNVEYCSINNSFTLISWNNTLYKAREVYKLNITKSGNILIRFPNSIIDDNIYMTQLVNGSQNAVAYYPISLDSEAKIFLINVTNGDSYLIIYYKGDRAIGNTTDIFNTIYTTFNDTIYNGTGDSIIYKAYFDNLFLDRNFNLLDNYHSLVFGSRNLSFGIKRVCGWWSCYDYYTFFGSIPETRVVANPSNNAHYDNLLIINLDNESINFSIKEYPNTYLSTTVLTNLNISSVQIQSFTNDEISKNKLVFKPVLLGYYTKGEYDNLLFLDREDIDYSVIRRPNTYETNYLILDAIPSNCLLNNISISGTFYLNQSINYTLRCGNATKYGFGRYIDVQPIIYSNITINSTTFPIEIGIISNYNYSICRLSLRNMTGTYYTPNLILENGKIYNYSMSGFTIGNNTVELACHDKVASKIFTTDFPPDINIISPANNSVFESSNVLININVTDENSTSCFIYLNDVLLDNFSNYYYNTINVQYAGLYNLTITCTDNRNINSKTISFTRLGPIQCNSCSDCSIKAKNPIYSKIILVEDIYSTQYDNYCINVENRNISIDCGNYKIIGQNNSGIGIRSHNSRVTIHKCYIENFSTNIFGNNSQLTIEDTITLNGDYGLKAISSNLRAYNSVFMYSNIYDVYNQNPTYISEDNRCNTYLNFQCQYQYYETTAPTVNITYPKYTRIPIANISIYAFDNYSQIITCNINNINISILRNTTQNVTVNLNPGINQLNITCVDQSLNSVEENITIILDQTPPNLTIISPENNSIIVGNRLVYNINVSDDYSETINCRINSIYITTQNPEEISDILLLPYGRQNVTFTCSDLANNSITSILEIDVRQSYLNLTPLVTSIGIPVTESRNLTFTINPILVSNISDVSLTLECGDLICDLDKYGFSYLDRTETINLNITVSPSSRSNRVILTASDRTYNTTLSAIVNVNILRPRIQITSNQTLNLTNQNVSFNISNIGNASIRFNHTISCLFCNNQTTEYYLDPNSSILITTEINIPYSYINQNLAITHTISSRLGVENIVNNLNVRQPNLVIPSYSMFTSENESSININIRNIGENLELAAVNPICPTGFYCNVDQASIRLNTSEEINLTFRAKTLGATSDGIARIRIYDTYGRNWQTTVNLKIAKPNLYIKANKTTVSYIDDIVTLSIFNNGTKSSEPGVLVLECNFCNQTIFNISSINVNSSQNLSVKLQINYSYNDDIYNISYIIIEQNGRNTYGNIIFNVPQANLSISYNNILNKGDNTVVMNLSNLGDLSLNNVNISLQCPTGWICEYSNCNLAPNCSTSLNVYVLPAESIRNIQIPLVVENNIKRYIIQTNFIVKQPNISIESNPFVYSGYNNISIIIKNVGDYQLEDGEINITLPYGWTANYSKNINLSANETRNLQVELYVPESESLSSRFIVVKIVDKYGIEWSKDIIVRIAQPDISYYTIPDYLELGPNYLNISLTNNGSRDIPLSTYQIICENTYGYILTSNAYELRVNQSLLLPAYINTVQSPQICNLIISSENLTISKRLLLNVKRLNLFVIRNFSNNIPVNSSINASFIIKNQEPYNITFDVFLRCIYIDCLSNPASVTLNPGESYEYNFTILARENNPNIYSYIELNTRYKSIIRGTNYSLRIIQPSLNIIAPSSINQSLENFTLLIHNNGTIDFNGEILIICPAGLDCNMDRPLYIRPGEILERNFTIKVVGSVSETERISVVARSPSREFRKDINVNIDLPIKFYFEEKDLILNQRNDILINTSMNSIAECSVDCDFPCSLNQTLIYPNQSLYLFLFPPFTETRNITDIRLRCNISNISFLYSKRMNIIQPKYDFNLIPRNLEFGNNELSLTVNKSFYNNTVTLICSGCTVNNIVTLNETKNLSLYVELPDSYNLNTYNITILLLDGVRNLSKTYVLYPRIPYLNINAPTATISRNSTLSYPIVIRNSGLDDAINVSVDLICFNLNCQYLNQTINISKDDSYILTANLTKDFDISDNNINVIAKVGRQIFQKSITISTNKPNLSISMQNSIEIVRNSSLEIPFNVTNLGGTDIAYNVSVIASCPSIAICNVSYQEGLNIFPNQYRSGLLNITVLGDIDRFYISLEAKEVKANYQNQVLINVERELDFSSVKPGILSYKEYNVNPRTVTVGDIDLDGINDIIFVNDSGLYYINYITNEIYLIENNTYSAISTYYDGNRYQIIKAKDNKISIENRTIITPFNVKNILYIDQRIVVAFTNNILTVYENYTRSNISIPINVVSLTSLDFNNDGYTDIVATDNLGQINIILYPYNNISYVFTNSNNNRDLKATISDVYVKGYPAVTTIDEIGELEIFYVNENEIYRNTFGRMSEYQMINSIDLDRDGDLDIILSNNSSIKLFLITSNINKYISSNRGNLNVDITIINPFYKDMENVQILDRWNIGEAYMTSNLATVKYISNRIERYNTRVYQLPSGYLINLPRGIKPLEKVVISYSLVQNASNPQLLKPEIRYKRASTPTKNLTVLLSDHINENYQYYVFNYIDFPYTNVVDLGDIFGEYPDFKVDQMQIRDYSNMKYVTSFEDPNVCLRFYYGDCPTCIVDPGIPSIGNTVLYAYTPDHLIPRSVLRNPVYGSWIGYDTSVINIGNTSGRALIGLYLNNIRFANPEMNLSVNQISEIPIRHSNLYRATLNLGNHTAKVLIDPDNLVTELSKDNNRLERSFEVTEYADYVLNDIILVDSNNNERYVYSSGEQIYILVNVSNLGNSEGYVFLNASVNGSEFFNNRFVGTIKCDYGRKPLLVRVNNNTIARFPVPILAPNLVNNQTYEIAVGIYPHITGYPEDINRSNNVIIKKNITIVPSPIELDFYNSTYIDGRLVNYSSPRVILEGRSRFGFNNLTVYIKNHGGIDAITNYSVYILNYTYSYNGTLPSVSPILTGTIDIPAISEKKVSFPINFRASPANINYSIVIYLDPIQTEDVPSNVLILYYNPIDFNLEINALPNPMPNTYLNVEYYIRAIRPNDRQYIISARNQNSILPSNYNYIEYNPSLIPQKIINISFNGQLIEQTNISNDYEVRGRFYIPVGDYSNGSNITVQVQLLDEEMNGENNVRTITINRPKILNLSLITNSLVSNSINLIEIHSNEDGKIGELSLLLYINGSYYTLLESGSLEGINFRKGINRLYVFVPNIEGNGSLILSYSNIGKIDMSLLNREFRIITPNYSKLLMIGSRLIVNNNTIVSGPNSLYDITGLVPRQSEVYISGNPIFYVYNQDIKIYNISIFKDSLEVTVR
jgi:hypothetical protein